MSLHSPLFCMFVLVAASLGAAEPSHDWRTLVYKRAGTLDIRADVLEASGPDVRPVVVWLHGGALINGHRASAPKWLVEACQAHRYVLVSLDYRLAPETQLPQVVGDVEDGLAWVRERGRELFRGDGRRIAVVGGSAGGYLTLTMGFRAKATRPVALVSLWGYGDLVGDWFSKPSPHPVHHRSKLSEAEARKQVAGPPVSDARDRKGDGGAFYQFCRQTGAWPREVSGWDPRREPEKFFPYMALKNVTRDYPPTLLIHGDQDTDVPVEQSQLMAAEFLRHEVKHRLVTVTGAEHGLAGAPQDQIEAAYRAAVEFLEQALGK